MGETFLILRSSWVYGLRGDSFVTRALLRARAREVLRVGQDQFGSPTWARMMAEATALLIANAPADVSA